MRLPVRFSSSSSLSRKDDDFSEKFSKLNVVQKFFFFLFSFMSKNKGNEEEHEALLPAPVDPKIEIINKSNLRVEKISDVKKFVIENDNVENFDNELFKKIVDKTVEIHNRIVNDENIRIHKLEQFHLYYTDNILNLLDAMKYVHEEEVIVKKSNMKFNNYMRYIDSHIKRGFSYDDIEHEPLDIEKAYENLLPEHMRKSIMMYIGHSAIDNEPIFYVSGILFKSNIVNGNKELIIINDIAEHIWDTEEKKNVVTNCIKVNNEKYILFADYLNKINELYESLDGREDRIEIEMINMRTILEGEMMNI